MPDATEPARDSLSYIVVGGGVLGLTSALRLADAGHRVTVIEQGRDLGGLTATRRMAAADGEVVHDAFYHVILESDQRLLALLERFGLRDEVRWTSAEATIVKDGVQYPATSLVDMARLPALTATDRARVALSVGLSLGLPRAASERLTSSRWLRLTAGDSAATHFWDPILRAKLGQAATQVSATFIVSTFRRLILARLKGGGDRFGALPNGYAPVFARMREDLESRGVTFLTGVPVTQVTSPGTGQGPQVVLEDGRTLTGDSVILTVPGPVARRIAPALPEAKATAPYLGVVCTALTLKHKPNNSYITYLVNDLGLTGIIGMHALLDPARCKGGNLVYLPRYCAPDDPWFDLPDEEILRQTLEAARQAIPEADWDHYDAVVSRAPYVVPLPVPSMPRPPDFVTPVDGVYVLSSGQNTTGTLNVEGSLTLAEAGLQSIMSDTTQRFQTAENNKESNR